MRTLILRGDGYLGWPTATYFSARGPEIHFVDDHLGRRAHAEGGADSLTPILESLPARAQAWRELICYHVEVTEGDLTDWSVVEPLFRDEEYKDRVITHASMPSTKWRPSRPLDAPRT
jgi:UDP-sulfoquinovose synthase